MLQVIKLLTLTHSNNPNATLYQGTWNGKGILNGTTQYAVTYNNRTVIIDASNGQVIDFYTGSTYGGLINLKRLR